MVGLKFVNKNILKNRDFLIGNAFFLPFPVNCQNSVQKNRNSDYSFKGKYCYYRYKCTIVIGEFTMNNMNLLPDPMLVNTYYEAIKLGLEKEFIDILYEEISRRKIRLQ